MQKALITGITGQDGSYLAELLLEKEYEVYGIIRRASTFNTSRINHIFHDQHDENNKLFLHYGDLSDAGNLSRLIEKIKPDEIYNLGAQSHVRVSFDIPEYTADITGLGAIRILDAIKESGIETRYYQASSSEMFGKAQEIPQKETTPFYPRSPYGCAKVFAYWATKNYRESYDIHASNGILFNHESPRRGETFVTRKITRGLSRIKLGVDKKLYLGNLDAKRDWGYTKDFVEGMWRMLQQPTGDDYVLATGESHSVREFAEAAAKQLEIDLVWDGDGVNEKGINRATNRAIIEIDPRYFRPAEVDTLLGDASKAKMILGWGPKVKFNELIRIMVEADFANEKYLAREFGMIKLVKSTFYNEAETKKKLLEFLEKAEILSMGVECAKFEEGFAKKQGRAFAVFVNSGSSANLALIQALLNLGMLKKGNTVGVSALTWATNVMPLIQLGLHPIVIDCRLDTLNVSLETLKDHSASVQAVFLTNVLGLSDNIVHIEEFCHENAMLLLEDNCESLGSKVDGKLLGNFGLASTFSFFVGHHLSTIEGGMICTDDEELADMLKMVRAHGWDRNLGEATKQALRKDYNIDEHYARYTFYDLAFNMRPTEIHGFLGNEQLQYWDQIAERREENFKQLHEVSKKNSDFLPLKYDHMDLVSNFAFPVICRDRDVFDTYYSRFKNNDVEILPIIAGNISQQPFFKKYGGRSNDLENANFIHRNGFYFGNNPELTSHEVEFLSVLLT